MKIWIHKKKKGEWTSSYSRTKGERIFNLTRAKRTITFESWQMAKKLGWSKRGKLVRSKKVI